VFALLAYIVVVAASTLIESGLLRVLGHLMALGIAFGLLVRCVFLPNISSISASVIAPVFVFTWALLGGLAFNGMPDSLGDLIKIIIAPLFVIIGGAVEVHRRGWSWDQKVVRWAFVGLCVLPLVVWLIQIGRNPDAFDLNAWIGIFVNRNNAALYGFSLLAIYLVLSGHAPQGIIPYLLLAVAFGTLGVLIATTVALLVVSGRLRDFVAIGLALATLAVLVIFGPDVGILSRIDPLVRSVQLLMNRDISLATVSYGDLVTLVGSSDLSFIFRLKHWLDLGTIYVDGGLERWIFGFGAGSSANLASARLIPHNDYFRILFEFGLVAALAFIVLVIKPLLALRRTWGAVPFIVIAIYFLTENLINNFPAMIAYFFALGAIAVRSQSAPPNAA
jgi:hypothetical protein